MTDLSNSFDNKHIRIIHLDAHIDELAVTKRILKKFDPELEIESVPRVEDFCLKLEQESFDCIVIDFVMPKRNGIEIAQEVLEKYDIPIIMYTARGSEEVASAAFEVGIVDYIRKDMSPSHYQVLAKRIRMNVDRYNAEKNIRESEEKFRNLAEYSPNMIFIYYNDIIKYANKKCEEMGYTQEEFLSPDFNFIDLITPEHRGLLKKNLQKHMSGEDIDPYEYSLITKDGKEVDAIISTKLIHYEKDRAILGIVTDVTDFKRMENDLKASEEHLKLLFEDAPDGIVTLDLKGFITSTNNAFPKYTGYSKNEIIGKHFSKLGTLRAKDLVNYTRIFSSIVRGNIPPPFRVTYKDKDGNISWSEAHVRLIKGKNGKKEIMVIARDITDRKKYEDKLEALHHQVLRLTKARDINEIYLATFQAMDKALEFSAIDLIKVEGGYLIDIHNKGPIRDPPKLSLKDKGITVRAVKTGKTQFVPDVSKDPDYVLGSINAQSELTVPVKIKDRVIAILNVESEKLNAFTREDQILLEILAEHVSSAILRIKSQHEIDYMVNHSMQTMEHETREISTV